MKNIYTLLICHPINPISVHLPHLCPFAKSESTMAEAALRAEIAKLQAELDSERTKSAGASAMPKVLYLSRERKQTVLSGRPKKDGDPDVDRWLDDIEIYIKTLESKAKQAEYIFDHLSGKAQDEIRLRPETVRADPEQVIAILRSVFGDRGSAVKLQREFFLRKQQPSESLYDFSLELLKMADSVEKKDKNAFQDKNNLLIEIFIEGVRDSAIKGELRHVKNDDPDISFFDFREKVCHWFDKEVITLKTSKSCEMSSESVEYDVASIHSSYKSGSKDDSASLAEVLKFMKLQSQKLEEQQKFQQDQQKKIDSLSNQLCRMKQYPSTQTNYRGRSQNQSTRTGSANQDGTSTFRPITCYTCGGKGHKSSQCPSDSGRNKQIFQHSRGQGRSKGRPDQRFNSSQKTNPKQNSCRNCSGEESNWNPTQ